MFATTLGLPTLSTPFLATPHFLLVLVLIFSLVLEDGMMAVIAMVGLRLSDVGAGKQNCRRRKNGGHSMKLANTVKVDHR